MNEKRRSMTVRLTEERFKEIKIKLINDNNKSFQDYVIELIKKDMKGEQLNG
jgi:predicted DNA binding CopG/RHH family protein